MTAPTQRPQTPLRPQYALVKIVTLLACVGTLGAALEISAQTITPRPGTPQFTSRFHLLAAAESRAGGGGSGAAPSDEQARAAELAKKLQNPIASLISVPMQNNWDFGIGPADAMRYTVNIQPVIPFSLTTDWNLVTRTIVPVIYAESPVPGGDNRAGLGDIVQSFFFSPKEPTRGGWIWGGWPGVPLSLGHGCGIRRGEIWPGADGRCT